MAAALALLVTVPALAHDSWISRSRLFDPLSRQWCCNEHDCAPVDANGVREENGGYRIGETGENIPYSRVIWQSEDGRWWRCRNLVNNATRCLIGPPPGF